MLITYLGCLYGPYGGHVHCRLMIPHKFSHCTTFRQGAIGVLDKTEMEHFASIFLAYQKLGESTDTQG